MIWRQLSYTRTDTVKAGNQLYAGEKIRQNFITEVGF